MSVTKNLFSFAAIAILVSSTSIAVQATEKITIKSEQDKISYSLGVKTAENLKEQDVIINPKAFAAGVTDVTNNRKLKLSNSQVAESIQKLQEQQVAKLKKQQQTLAKKNLTSSKKFLQDNKKKSDIVTTTSGLQYKVLTKGNGQSPKLTDYVTVHYRGTLLDGTEFDSSYKRNKATTFQLNKLILGWQEAIAMMKPGSKWKLFIPPELAYGEHGAGKLIQPNSALIFDIELLEFSANKT